MIVLRRFRSLLLLVTASPNALAQTPAPDAGATVPPIIYSLPGTPSPTPVSTPAPVDTPTPAASPSPRSAPTPRATPTPRTAPLARPTATPEPRATGGVTPSTVAPESSPTPVIATPLPKPSIVAASPTPVATAATEAGAGEGAGTGWFLPLGVLLALGAGGAWLWSRRRRDVEGEAAAIEPVVAPLPVSGPDFVDEEPSPAAAVAAAAPRMLSRRSAAPVAPAIPAERAWIELELRPRRAGLNMLTATADVDVLVRNRGSADAVNVRLDARLTSARADQDAELGQIFADTRGRTAASPFTLAPGGERVVRAVVTLPREAINVLTAAQRPMFVPVVTLNARYALGSAGEGQTAQAFALGIERAGAAKLAPFWLDAPSRMFEAVAARPHALAITS
jgi:hypothetical protein